MTKNWTSKTLKKKKQLKAASWLSKTFSMKPPWKCSFLFGLASHTERFHHALSRGEFHEAHALHRRSKNGPPQDLWIFMVPQQTGNVYNVFEGYLPWKKTVGLQVSWKLHGLFRFKAEEPPEKPKQKPTETLPHPKPTETTPAATATRLGLPSPRVADDLHVFDLGDTWETR